MESPLPLPFPIFDLAHSSSSDCFRTDGQLFTEQLNSYYLVTGLPMKRTVVTRTAYYHHVTNYNDSSRHVRFGWGLAFGHQAVGPLRNRLRTSGGDLPSAHPPSPPRPHKTHPLLTNHSPTHPPPLTHNSPTTIDGQ